MDDYEKTGETIGRIDGTSLKCPNCDYLEDFDVFTSVFNGDKDRLACEHCGTIFEKSTVVQNSE